MISQDQIKAFGRVGVLYGGRSAEREVSKMSGSGVLQALRSKGVDAHPFDPAERSLGELQAEKFDRVFIALHGRYGEDGTLQGALEQMGLPYTGPGVMASSIAMDKIMTKRIWLAHGLPTPRFAVLDAKSTTREQLRTVPDELGLPLMLKAPHEGSTIGIAKVNGYSDVQAGFDLCARYDDVVLAEEFIRGRELTVPVIGSGRDARALPVIEIRAPEGNYDYQHKYFTDDTKYLCPAPVSEELTQRLQELAVQAFHAVGCRGWSRVDFMLREKDGQAEPYLLEINTSPGMTSHSLVPMAAKALGLSYEDLCCEILQLAALDMTPSKNWTPQADQS
ncbi:D-alanine--D-alanine ligase [Herbaspirillum robiniae]|uniref:D-alanine--D-alanine ligase n=1 Tax=Herbaspirillum robiniae TaxID=2014887 RepID=A0A246WKS1_9BURK|nr:D-alanine--D-alanine ligase [Herbaspirillum robiniae]NUU02145.1 D-alanine--D-alanine ligase [Herbaspirillum robiniae]OWY26833.1 D-alanine--D-alanine ligase [Herbaspirillum robiniae]